MTLFFLYTYLLKQSFSPSFAGVFFNPFYFIRRALYHKINQLSKQLSGKLLDFGCGRKPYEHLFTVNEYIGVDVDQTGHDHKNSKVDIYYDGKMLPFEANSFDSIFCSEVLEHLMNADDVLADLYRVLKPGGKMLLTAPFCWNEHEMPFDYARYSSEGIRHLLQKHGFTITAQEKSGNFARVLLQLLTLYFYELTKQWGRFGLVISMIFIIPLNIIGVVVLPLFPVNKTMYFNNIVLAEKSQQV